MTTELSSEDLHHLIEHADENENLDFKEAKTQFDRVNLYKYCVALSNEGGGRLILGVTDKRPRNVTGSSAFSKPSELGTLKNSLVDKLGIRIDASVYFFNEKRILVFSIPSRPQGQPVSYEGSYWMRSGKSLKPMKPDTLKRIFDEGKQDWFSLSAIESIDADTVISLLDTQSYFDLLDKPYPTNREAVLEKLKKEHFITKSYDRWAITNLGSILLAKQLEDISPALAAKAPRFIIYEASNKLKTKEEIIISQGYAVGFEKLVALVYRAAPNNQVIQEAIREELKVFPKQAIRELVANALVHQDFLATGKATLIEMYNDRVEFTNPGSPPIHVERFIDGNKAANENFANYMRKLGICEEKSSGVDKVVHAAEFYQLPAPEFIVSNLCTIAILFAHKDFSEMSKKDRIRACYQHCCLMYVTRKHMSNESLRKRFGLPKSKAATISGIISKAKNAGLVCADESETQSTRYARYIPTWA